MIDLLYALLATARSSLRPQRELALENLALGQQLAILKRKPRAPPNPASASSPMEGRSSLSRWWAGCIIATPDAQPTRRSRSDTVSGGGVTFANSAS